MFTTKLFKFSTLAGMLVVPMSSAFAGVNGTMTYHFLATGIPTLSGTMLVVLSLLLFAVAVRVSKQKNSGAGKFFVALIGIGALSMGGGGIKLISDINAAMGWSPASLPLNGEVELGLGYNRYQNDLHPAQATAVIDAIIPPDGETCGPYVNGEATTTAAISVVVTPLCEVGLNVPHGTGCEIWCTGGEVIIELPNNPI